MSGHRVSVQGSRCGITKAPQIFTRAMAPVSVILHQYGVCILWYLDDCLVLIFSLTVVIVKGQSSVIFDPNRSRRLDENEVSATCPQLLLGL